MVKGTGNPWRRIISAWQVVSFRRKYQTPRRNQVAQNALLTVRRWALKLHNSNIIFIVRR
jgi:hypothetical protein